MWMCCPLRWLLTRQGRVGTLGMSSKLGVCLHARAFVVDHQLHLLELPPELGHLGSCRCVGMDARRRMHALRMLRGWLRGTWVQMVRRRLRRRRRGLHPRHGAARRMRNAMREREVRWVLVGLRIVVRC